jgi:hypothetical protein
LNSIPKEKKSTWNLKQEKVSGFETICPLCNKLNDQREHKNICSTCEMDKENDLEKW